METPIKRLKRLSAMSRNRVSKATAMVDKIKKVVDAAKAAGQEAQSKKE